MVEVLARHSALVGVGEVLWMFIRVGHSGLEYLWFHCSEAGGFGRLWLMFGCFVHASFLVYVLVWVDMVFCW